MWFVVTFSRSELFFPVLSSEVEACFHVVVPEVVLLAEAQTELRQEVDEVLALPVAGQPGALGPLHLLKG